MFKCLTEILQENPLAPVFNTKCSLTEQFKFTGVNFLTKNGLGIEIKFEFTNYLFFHI